MIDDITGWRIHGPDTCAETVCVFHNPSNHHMVTWPKELRTDWGVPLIERLCQHGIGHPDPDSVAWLMRMGHEGFGTHGCDGCCRSIDADVKEGG